MVVIFYGTSAELIKLLGLVKGTERESLFLICTAQQREQLEQFHAQSAITPDLYLAHGWRGRDVLNILEMIGFMLKVHMNFIRHYYKIRHSYRRYDTQHRTKSLAVVHGDTLTTVVGAYMGRLLGLQVSHIEAGLRSGKLLHPFPEEIDRRIVSRIARIHFAPNDVAVENLVREQTRGDIIDTRYNTSKDAMKLADNFRSEVVDGLALPGRFGLVSIHRTELLERKKELEDFLRVVGESVTVDMPMVFLDHSTTKEKLKVLRLDHYLERAGMHRIPKLAYMDFIQVVKKADYIITDSGGLQEDAYFLGVPTIIHRLTTERNEGLGINVELSYLKTDNLRSFINRQKGSHEITKLDDDVSPSGIVLDYLRENKYIV